VSVFLTIRNLLSDPRLKAVDYNSDDLTEVHRRILAEKKLMRDVFFEFYATCMALDRSHLVANGKRVEVGAGVSLFKTYYPDLISTDIKVTPSTDLVADAQRMPFEDASLGAVYGINCFHHFPAPDQFLRELERVLQVGGGCVLIEPYYGIIARRFYKRLFDTEVFDMHQKEWSKDALGIMVGANQALSYVVFRRDRELFCEKFPRLEILLQQPLNNYIRYVASGGLNFRQLVPNICSPLLKAAEFMLFPLSGILALHHVILIRKKK
jgi:SAM-dependent methyltransferase